MRRQRRAKWILAGVSACLFLWIVFSLEAFKPVDQWIYGLVSQLISPAFTVFMQGVTLLASPLLLLPICFVLAFWPPCKEYRVPLMLNLMVSVLLNLSLKNTFARARPADVLLLVMESGYSFPSGHTMAAACFYGFLIWMVRRSKLSKGMKSTWTALLSLTVLLVGLSRIYLGAHFFTDVFAGLCVSILYLLSYTAVIGKYFGHRENVLLKAHHPERSSLFSSFGFALDGIVQGLQTERNMVIHFGVMVLVVVFGALLGLSPMEWVVCILLFGLVFMAELLNTALETVVDMVTPAFNPRAKQAKDMAAGAVLVISAAAALIGAIIFIPKLLAVVQAGFYLPPAS